jgi:hypothetical protein
MCLFLFFNLFVTWTQTNGNNSDRHATEKEMDLVIFLNTMTPESTVHTFWIILAEIIIVTRDNFYIFHHRPSIIAH